MDQTMNGKRHGERLTLRREDSPQTSAVEADNLSASEYDALAELFLASDVIGSGTGSAADSAVEIARATEGGPAARLSPRPESPAIAEALRAVPAPMPTTPVLAADGVQDRIEGMILGHLPVLAAAWAGQYARRLAEEIGGVVALVRLQGGQASIDLVGSPVVAYREEVERSGLRSGGRTLDEALRLASEKSRAWLIRADEPDEPELAECAGVTHITLLTGADDAALVASYRTIKSLSRRLESAEDERAPELRLAIMGAEDTKAQEARAKLERTAAAFLSRPISLVIGEQRMAPIPSINLHRASCAASAAKVVAMIRGVVERRLCGDSGSSSRIGPAARTVLSAQRGAIENGQAGVSDNRAHAGALASPPLSAKQVGAPPASSFVEARTRAGNEVDLASHLAGLSGLPTRCPYNPGVQFAIDAEGSLHLLALAPPGLTGESSVREAVGQLVAVAGWAYDHAELLRLASPGAAIVADPARTALHLLTDQPRDARRLLDSGVHVHLLSAARQGKETLWVCRDLN